MVELDEELHFNRYRAQTLQPVWAAALPWHDDYIDFSSRHELHCLAAGKWGKRWTNPSCESMFGAPEACGSFEGVGAPRWKQRALYDAMKDIAALSPGKERLARVSVWDKVGSTKLGDALIGGTQIDLDHLRDLVARRTTSRPELT